jgi:hypothetical protein
MISTSEVVLESLDEVGRSLALLPNIEQDALLNLY